MRNRFSSSFWRSLLATPLVLALTVSGPHVHAQVPTVGTQSGAQWGGVALQQASIAGTVCLHSTVSNSREKEHCMHNFVFLFSLRFCATAEAMPSVHYFLEHMCVRGNSRQKKVKEKGFSARPIC
jgi:hypothetical protein